MGSQSWKVTRLLGPRDAEHVVQYDLARRAPVPSHIQRLRRRVFSDDPRFYESGRRGIASTSHVVSLESSRAALAYAWVKPADDDRLILEEVGVHPDLRRSGVSRRLLIEVAHWAEAEGFTFIWATPLDARPDRVAWLSALGFEKRRITYEVEVGALLSRDR